MRITKKTASFISLLIFLIVGSAFVGNNEVYAETESTDKTVLKVAFPEVKGLSEMDENGNPKGLVVDYLNEIAKYTNWEYEYITGDSEELVVDFMAGKYDLMGGTYYSPDLEEYFAYPEYNMGSNRAILFCREDNSQIKSFDLKSLDGKTIGVYEKATEKIRRLQEYLDFNGLQCELKYYTKDDLIDDNLYPHLENGEIDLLLGNDLENIKDFRIAASFEAQPYYITTPVGKKEILAELNLALEHILEADPEFADEHYSVNFPQQHVVDIQYNQKELDYIQNTGEIKVAVLKSWHPFYCIDIDNQHHNGIIPDILDKVTEFSGLKFTYVYADTYTDAIHMVNDGDADILGWFLDTDEIAKEEGLALTKPVISMNNMILKNKSVDYPSGDLTGAVIEGRTLPDNIKAKKVKYYSNVEEGVRAVNKGEADFVYGLSTSLEAELQKPFYSNITTVSFFDNSTPVSFGISRPASPELLSILNKGIGKISSEEKDAITGRNFISSSYSAVTLTEVIYQNPMVAISFVAVFLLLILLIVVLVFRSRVRNTMMQEELRRAEAESKAKGEFLSRMSHEIRTPMNAIAGLVDLTCMKKELPKEVKTNLGKIRSSTQYLLALLNDILDMSRIDGGMLTITAEEFSLKKMLNELEGMFKMQYQQKQQQSSFHIDISHDWVVGDAIRLRQVLTNLLSNAYKFTPAGGRINLEIKELSADSEHASYRFTVADTGVGIAPENQEQIFEAFEQLGSNISKSEGTGLGLPISQSIVKMMGGKLELQSLSGKGTEFFFTLVLPLGSGVQLEEKEEETDPDRVFLGKRILLAEDNDLNAEIAEELLKMKGMLPERAANGQEAVDLFKKRGAGYFQLILMDLQMPVKNGLEAAAEIRRACTTIPIVAMTANSFHEDMDAARNAGMNDFITKPVDSNYMYEILKKYMK